jgi:hypothetical protein
MESIEAVLQLFLLAMFQKDNLKAKMKSFKFSHLLAEEKQWRTDLRRI